MSTRTCSRYKFRTRTVLYCTYSLVRVRVQDLEDLKPLAEPAETTPAETAVPPGTSTVLVLYSYL